MPARVFSAALVGVEAVLVRVEVDVASGLPAFTTVGLPDLAVRESRERVRTAIRKGGGRGAPKSAGGIETGGRGEIAQGASTRRSKSTCTRSTSARLD